MLRIKKIIYISFIFLSATPLYSKAYLTVLCGSMASGKSDMFIRTCRRYIVAEEHIIVFKHAFDNRILHNQTYDPSAYVASRSGSTIHCISVMSIDEMRSLISDKTYSIIAIDEAQFFNKQELLDFVHELLALDKTVIIAGLELDFKGETFGAMGDLLALADEVIKLKAICCVCKQDKFCITQRLIDGKPAHYDDPLIMVGESAYEPRCRNDHRILPAKHNHTKEKE